MIKYWCKNRLLYTLILTMVVAICCGVFFYAPYIEKCSENHYKTSTYEETIIDYDIPSPSYDQLNEIGDLDFVEGCFGYYITEGNLDINGKSVKTKLMLTDNEDLSLSVFSLPRQIEFNDSYDAPVLYVGYDYAKENSLSLGDSVKYGGFEIVVGGIAEPDAYRDSQLVWLGKDSELDQYIKSRTSSYSGAFVHVNDKTEAEKYFKTYKPLGRLRDVNEFDSEEKYKIHFDAWNDADYSNEITSFEEKLRDVRLTNTDQLVFGLVVYAILMVSISVVLFVRKSERVYFKQKKSKRGLTGYYFNTMILEILVPGIALLIICYLVKNDCQYYVPEQIFRKSALVIGISVVGTAVIDFLLNLSMKRKVTK